MKVVMIGAGGQCKSMIPIVRSLGYEIEGLVDGEKYHGKEVLGEVVKFTDDEIPELAHKYAMIIAIGQTPRVYDARKNMYERLCGFGVRPEAIVSRCAIVLSDYSQGVVIHDMVYVGSNCEIGENTILNTGVIIEHDCKIGKHCHIAPGSVVIGGVRIADEVVIGAGSVVVHDIDESGFWAGSPARMISKFGLIQ